MADVDACVLTENCLFEAIPTLYGIFRLFWLQLFSGRICGGESGFATDLEPAGNLSWLEEIWTTTTCGLKSHYLKLDSRLHIFFNN